ncbi:initiator tRNA phosphoribosyl transferase [Macrolepiota fuliginosa MF-IS2]|uniref:Initiator tRNA phosphoribosyl transferase n=1 Tax=Macrolepiota fuliginosa MF-IS2 TaxID=1400762 RepID=A0A9P5XC36_9AGAR|nr:initiator tRNA phosphoribosyl transferase [Macrolepiota fuliginosa MF-IS2]
MTDLSVSFNASQAGHEALAALRRESLDIYNRLHSIQEDTGFVNHVHGHYPNLPFLPNLRCGAWYTDPAFANDTPAYFKSTDGHTGNWSFNLRRANLHLLALIAEKRGIVLVDSTRAGKRMPDALSKTVPIWCTVVNRAILIRRHRGTSYDHVSDWDTQLYVPPGVVSAQEHDQIVKKIGGWANALADSSFDLPLDLPAPLRPLWITPSTTTFPVLNINSESPSFLPIVCLSASKRVEAGTERRVAGYAYVQGSGDDHELWGMGLTPQLFWKHRPKLISSPRNELENLIKQILLPSSSPSASPHIFPKMPTSVPIQKIDGRICLASFSSLDLGSLLCSLRSQNAENPKAAHIVLDFSLSDTGEAVVPNANNTSICNILHIHANPKTKPKSDAHFLQHVLPTATPFIRSHLSTSASNTVYIFEGCGNDPGTRLDPSIGIAVVAMQLLFDKSGRWLKEGATQQGNSLCSCFELHSLTPLFLADKQSVRTRLEWIIESEPRANPSRATLKRVNEFLLTPSAYLIYAKS